jgi:hypothetical protein
MKHNHLSQIILAAIIVIFAGCTNPNSLPSYPQLQGTVGLEDSTGTLIPPPYSGITVSIPSANLSTSTDAQGNFSFLSEPGGSFDEVISKKGFDSTIRLIPYNWGPCIGQQLQLTNAPDSIVTLELVDQTPDPAEIYVYVRSKASHVFFVIDTLDTNAQASNVLPPSDSIHLVDPVEIRPSAQVGWFGGIGSMGYGFKEPHLAFLSAFAVQGDPVYDTIGKHRTIVNAGPRSNQLWGVTLQ